ncbi:hypothetical protein GPECTOR_20g495 [Gonium pectorale]|uniref:phytol kinase n=1 Tax=Gonium pectorale TaxID=33097 RepID=A0A150GIK0_GONPE|nr:hypothetical protein GPECTOR_20g495 [Gonium pectorale]|eukprot:KXZ49638.1 hypothetical protein GPECTOR_20g495 [Gonium pectorale]
MPPPAAARRLLRTCANPGCANLDGDSEAGLRLTPCAGCDVAAYCCRDCCALAVTYTPGAAAAVLNRAPNRSALLRLLAAALRFPVSDWIAGFAAGDGGSGHLRASVALRTVSCVVSLTAHSSETTGSVPQAFLRAAVRTQALHAASRQLATLGEALAPTAVAAVGAGGEAEGVPGPDGPPGGKEAVVDTATPLLHFTYSFLNALICSLPPGVPELLHAAPPDQPLVAELAEALESSHVLDHAARVLLLVLVGMSGPLPIASAHVFGPFISVHTNLAMLAYGYCCSTDAATAATGARLRIALCGRCVTHVTLCLGLSTLMAADGGTSYGLDEILDVAFRTVAAREGGSGLQPPSLAATTGMVPGDLAIRAFAAARQNLYPPDPIGGWSAATDADAEVQLWRLGVSGLRWALPGVEEARARAHCHNLEAAWHSAKLESGWMASDLLRLPPSPPRPVAAALSGGLLPCLEYLLRGAGRDPGGWQAAAVGQLAWLGEHLAPLLAYGDVGEAAALVATLGKLLRRAMADPRVVEGAWDYRSNVWHAVLLMVLSLAWDLTSAQPAAEDVIRAAGPEPEAAAAGIAEAAPEPASPASQQLVSLLSFAACRWLPPLSRLAQHSLRADIGRGDGSGRGDGGGDGSSNASDIAPATTSLLLSASLSWVPLLGACCGPQAAHRAPAPEGDGGSERDGCDDDGSWRVLLLEEAETVPLLGVALGALPELEAKDIRSRMLPLLRQVAHCSGHLAALLLADTARGAAPDAAGPSGGGARGSAVGAGKCAGSAEGGGGTAGPGSRPPLPALPWGPELLRGLGAQLRAYESPAEAEAVEAVAAAMDCWAGEEAVDGEGGGSGAARFPELGLAPALLRLASAMPPPAAARRLLRTCANPGCANLDGDSEAGLRLTPCAGCGDAAYCCRDCWTAHWRAGHRAACARRLGGAG